MTTATWWGTDLSHRYQPSLRGLRPDGASCWCCGGHGTEYRPGWMECRNHDEGPVRWYGGAEPLALSNGMRALL